MQMAQEERMILSNVDNSQDFKIVNNAKMFAILSSGIYENPIRAIVRELSCNALDSHIENGEPNKPFRVQLPSRFEPMLEIEDFGIGLDHEGVTNLYTSYGESTKMASNDVIGALGLGSKTPFAYTETFTVRARKDGVENWYNAYIGESGFPTISRTSTHATDEQNGLMIQLPVKDEDAQKFRDEAMWVFQSFRVIPDGLPDSIDDRVRDISNRMYEQFDTRGFFIKSGYQFEFMAMMGNIQYRLPTEMMRQHFNDELEYIQMRHGNSRIVLPFEIGQLNIAASRESLNFTETESDMTFRAIKQKISDTISVEIKELQDEIDQKENWIQAIQFIRGKGLISVSGVFSYKGRKISDLMTESVNFRTPLLNKVEWDDTAYNTAQVSGYDRRVYFNAKLSDQITFRRDTLAEKPMHILYNNTGRRYLVPTVAREYANKHWHDIIICLMEPISKKNMKRLKRLHPELVIKPLAPMVEAYKEENGKNKETRTVGKYKDNTEIKARAIVNGNLEGQEKYNVEELRQQGKRIAYFDSRDMDNRRFMKLRGTGNYEFEFETFSSTMMRFLGVDIVLIGNKSNMKRIEANDIENIDDIFDAHLPMLKNIKWANEVMRSRAVRERNDDPKELLENYIYHSTPYYSDVIMATTNVMEKLDMISFDMGIDLSEYVRKANAIYALAGRKVRASEGGRGIARNIKRGSLFFESNSSIIRNIDTDIELPELFDEGMELRSKTVSGIMDTMPLLKKISGSHDSKLQAHLEEYIEWCLTK